MTSNTANRGRWIRAFVLVELSLFLSAAGYAQPSAVPQVGKTSYMPVAIEKDFADTMKEMSAAKEAVVKRQMALLEDRYDLSNRPAKGLMMSGGRRAVQEGIRARLPQGLAWEKLAAMAPEEIREKGLFPKAFMPLPHPNHPEGGMLFPAYHIKEILRQTGRDLTRFDLDFDLPDHLLPEYPRRCS